MPVSPKPSSPLSRFSPSLSICVDLVTAERGFNLPRLYLCCLGEHPPCVLPPRGLWACWWGTLLRGGSQTLPCLSIVARSQVALCRGTWWHLESGGMARCVAPCAPSSLLISSREHRSPPLPSHPWAPASPCGELSLPACMSELAAAGRHVLYNLVYPDRRGLCCFCCRFDRCLCFTG